MRFTFKTNGRTSIIDITDRVTQAVSNSKTKDGIVLVFVPGSTAAITTIENESGVLQDFKDVFERLVPEQADYRHHDVGFDKNGSAHIRSALLGPSLVIPFDQGKLQLGTWQQIVLIDFDEKPRERKVIIQIK